eukprot:SAG11_NODE_1534_length_4732_cov_1.778545_1_plen_202_part_00
MQELAEECEAEAEVEAEADAKAEEPTVDIEALTAELEAERTSVAELEERTKTLNEQLMRSLAEQENVRAIAKRDVDNARKFGIQKFAMEMLDVCDNLNRASDHVPAEFREAPAEEATELEKSMSSLYTGVTLTETVLLKALGKFDVIKFDPVGEKVDPNLHDVKMTIPDPEKDSGTVGLVLRPGYMMGKRVLRAAEVGVIS